MNEFNKKEDKEKIKAKLKVSLLYREMKVKHFQSMSENVKELKAALFLSYMFYLFLLLPFERWFKLNGKCAKINLIKICILIDVVM